MASAFRGNAITVTTNYTMTTDDFMVRCNPSADMTVTLPSASEGPQFVILTALQVTHSSFVVPAGSDTVGYASVSPTQIDLANQRTLMFVSDGVTNWTRY